MCGNLIDIPGDKMEYADYKFIDKRLKSKQARNTVSKI